MTARRRSTKQPAGMDGVQNTWDRVAEAAVRGGEDERVRSHATYVIRDAGWPTSKRARAEAFLADTRTLRHVDDPVNAEFVPEAWTMMPNHVTGEAPMFVAEDCDGLTVRWLSLCLAAGIPAKVIGYVYGPTDELHVAGSIWDDETGAWLDGDPSLQHLPLGQKVPGVTRRQERELPSMTITCDDTYCPINQPPVGDGSVENFVSVGSPPNHVADVPGDVLLALGTEMSDTAQTIADKWQALKVTYDDMRARFDAYGIHTVSDLAPYGWTADIQQQAVDAGVMAMTAVAALRDAAAGTRGVWPVTLPSGETTYAIEGRPSDPVAVSLDANGNPGLMKGGVPFHGATPDNSIGNPVAIAAAVAVIWVAAAYAIGKILDNLRDIARTTSRTFLESKVYECQSANPPCTPAELERRLAEFHKYEVDQAKADADLERAKGTGTNPLDTFNNVVYALGALGAIYGGIQVIRALTEHKAAAKAK